MSNLGVTWEDGGYSDPTDQSSCQAGLGREVPFKETLFLLDLQRALKHKSGATEL